MLFRSLYDDSYYAEGSGDRGYSEYMAQKREYAATFQEDLRRIEGILKASAGPLRILDVGCGPGFFVETALAAGHDAYGVDIIPSVVEHARALLPGRIFLGAPADVETVRNRPFDAIFASHVIEHVPGPLPFTSGLVPFLKPGGILVYVTPNIRSRLARISGRRWVSFKIPEHVAYYSPQTIGRLFSQAGLDPVVVDPAYQYYRIPFIALRLRRLIRPFDKLIPPLEHSRALRDRIVRITSGSLRAIASRGPVRRHAPSS